MPVLAELAAIMNAVRCFSTAWPDGVPVSLPGAATDDSFAALTNAVQRAFPGIRPSASFRSASPLHMATRFCAKSKSNCASPAGKRNPGACEMLIEITGAEAGAVPLGVVQVAAGKYHSERRGRSAAMRRCSLSHEPAQASSVSIRASNPKTGRPQSRHLRDAPPRKLARGAILPACWGSLTTPRACKLAHSPSSSAARYRWHLRYRPLRRTAGRSGASRGAWLPIRLVDCPRCGASTTVQTPANAPLGGCLEPSGLTFAGCGAAPSRTSRATRRDRRRLVRVRRETLTTQRMDGRDCHSSTIAALRCRAGVLLLRAVPAGGWFAQRPRTGLIRHDLADVPALRARRDFGAGRYREHSADQVEAHCAVRSASTS